MLQPQTLEVILKGIANAYLEMVETALGRKPDPDEEARVLTELARFCMVGVGAAVGMDTAIALTARTYHELVKFKADHPEGAPCLPRRH